MNDLEFKVNRVFRLSGDTKLKAFVDLTINNALLIRGIRVIEGRNGAFVAMPSEKAKDDKWYESVRCLNDDIKTQIRDVVLDAVAGQSVEY